MADAVVGDCYFTKTDPSFHVDGFVHFGKLISMTETFLLDLLTSDNVGSKQLQTFFFFFFWGGFEK